MRVATIIAFAAAGLGGFGLASAKPEWGARLGSLLRGAQAESQSAGHGHGHGHGEAHLRRIELARLARLMPDVGS